MNRILLFRGCIVPVLLPAYEVATTQVLEKFGIKVVMLNKANCCGSQYIEALNQKAFLALNGRILALAEAKGADILALCGACTRSLKSTKNVLDSDNRTRIELNSLLREEGLEYTGSANVKHLLDVIQEDIGMLSLKKAIVNPYNGIRLAVHYGCQVIRSNGALNLEASTTPTILDNIIRIAGGISVDFESKNQCCGGPLSAMDKKLAGKIGRGKISSIRAAGAKGIITVCAYCVVQLTHAQFGNRAGKTRLPVLTLPQFLGPALGILDDDLGIQMNRISPSQLLNSLSGMRE
ncbi:MAG: CoB--CoM heterodisulfide reductase iron-sulfur subunit B family protein [Candidatus Odinarchaeota archaeon]